MGLHPWLDEHFPSPGTWVGLSLGGVTVRWLTHLLSAAAHRLNHVEAGAEKRLHTRRGCTGQRLHPVDVSDDHLAAILAARRQDDRWSALEGTLNQHLRGVYDRRSEGVRLESPTASGSWTVTTEEGRCPCGPRPDHRPALPPVKVRRSALEPLGLPVATEVVAGQRADDPLDVPALARVRQSRGRRGRLDLGDGQVGAWETRACVHAGGDSSLGPLSARQVPPTVLAASLAPVWTGDQALMPRSRGQLHGRRALSADGVERLEPLTAVVGGEGRRWTERRVVIRSPQLAKAQAARAALNDRRPGKRRGTERPARHEAVAAIVARSHVPGLRQERDDHATGWIRLLSLGRRGLTRLEFVVRRGLAAAPTPLAGLSVGHPQRRPPWPTAERRLEAVQDLTLTIIREGRRRRCQLTPLSRLHPPLLARLSFSMEISTRRCVDAHTPP